jgi:drug/metabolite transporter (DMT)-like permease
MFLGFFAWYRGLALGGVAKVSQIQLVQPVLTVAASVVLLGQRLEPAAVVAAVAVLACVAAAQRTRVARLGPPAGAGLPAQRSRRAAVRATTRP